LGASPSTKYVIPTEFVRLADQIGGYVTKGMASAGELDEGVRPPRGDWRSRGHASNDSGKARTWRGNFPHRRQAAGTSGRS